jgi:hypothetical protein
MKYALGNMLNGAGGLNADQLALDLQFAADKTLTARKGPTPVLTRGSTGTFVGSNGLIQTAASGAARFDHDPVTLACKGLLIEEGRTNLLTRSEGLDANPWFPINTTTITSNNATAPDGATTAERFTVGGTTQSYGVFSSASSWTSGVTYTTSFFCKADQVTRVRIATGNPATHPISVIFDLTGSGSIIGTPTGTASIERYANGWYRCAVTATSTATGLTSLRLTAVTGTTDNYPGNSVDSFLAWGAQNEVGSFATSYIPTTTSALARSADVCSITGANFTGMFNSSDGTLFSQSILSDLVGLNRGIVNIRGGATQFIRSIYSNTLFRSQARANDAETTLSTATGLVFTAFKMAIAYSGNDFASSINGASPSLVTRTLPTGLSELRVGSLDTSNQLNGTISSLRYYKKRLPNEKLQALTA